MRFTATAVRLQLHALLANFLRTIATSDAVKSWSLTSLRERLIITGRVKHARYSVFQDILSLINGLRGPPLVKAAA